MAVRHASDQLRAGVVRLHGQGCGVLRVEFGEGGVDVFDVELHLQRDRDLRRRGQTTWSILVLRRTRTQVGGS